jgi:hypothetical protein
MTCRPDSEVLVPPSGAIAGDCLDSRADVNGIGQEPEAFSSSWPIV